MLLEDEWFYESGISWWKIEYTKELLANSGFFNGEI